MRQKNAKKCTITAVISLKKINQNIKDLTVIVCKISIKISNNDYQINDNDRHDLVKANELLNYWISLKNQALEYKKWN